MGMRKSRDGWEETVNIAQDGDDGDRVGGKGTPNEANIALENM